MTTSYNLTNIRTLLNEGFTDADLRRFCHDTSEFKPVYDGLAGTTGKTAIIDMVLEHAGRYLLLDNVLAWARMHNLVQYSKYRPYYEGPRRIFISYKRNVEPDASLAQDLYEALTGAGHQVFIDQTMKVGAALAEEIRRQIEACDFLLVLLSEASSNSEMVAQEIKHAHQHYQHTGKARLLPIRVNYDLALPYQLSHYLDKLQHVEWRSQADNDRLARQLLEAINDLDSLIPPVQALATLEEIFAAPRPYTDPRFIKSLRDPTGAVRPRSKFYVEREGDRLLSWELAKPYGTTITIYGPRQTGKSSLMIRGVEQTRRSGGRAVFINLQPIGDSYLQNLDTFLRYFSEFMVAELGLNRKVAEKFWSSSVGPSDKTTYLMEEYILPEVGTRVFLALDEADYLLRTNFCDTFFGLLRYWHNRRAMVEIWDQLDIVIGGIAVEAHTLIRDITQSPFNVGINIRLHDFNETQAWELNERYQSPISERELSAVMALLGGHPYLTAKAFYTMVTNGLKWDQLEKIAISDRGPFNDHLRMLSVVDLSSAELKRAMKEVIRQGKCPDEVLYHHLYRAGLIKGPGKACSCRCRLYEEYLKEHL